MAAVIKTQEHTEPVVWTGLQ